MIEHFENKFEQGPHFSAGYPTEPATPDGWDAEPRASGIPEAPDVTPDRTEVAPGHAANMGDFIASDSES